MELETAGRKETECVQCQHGSSAQRRMAQCRPRPLNLREMLNAFIIVVMCLCSHAHMCLKCPHLQSGCSNTKANPGVFLTCSPPHFWDRVSHGALSSQTPWLGAGSSTCPLYLPLWGWWVCTSTLGFVCGCSASQFRASCLYNKYFTH